MGTKIYARIFTSIFEVKISVYEVKLWAQESGHGSLHGLFEVKLRAWIFSAQDFTSKFEVKICAYEVMIRAYEVKSCAYKLNV